MPTTTGPLAQVQRDTIIEPPAPVLQRPPPTGATVSAPTTTTTPTPAKARTLRNNGINATDTATTPDISPGRHRVPLPRSRRPGPGVTRKVLDAQTISLCSQPPGETHS